MSWQQNNKITEHLPRSCSPKIVQSRVKVMTPCSTSVIYHNRPNPHYANAEVTVPELRENLAPLSHQYLDRLSDATAPIFQQGQLRSNGVAISKTLLLTTGPYQQGESVLAQDRPAKVIFDGSQDGFPFQILEIEEPVPDWLPLGPPQQDTPSIQISCKKRLPANEVSQTGSYHPPNILAPALPGTPCISLYSGKLYAIHRGDIDDGRRPLLISTHDIYDYLVMIAKHDALPKGRKAAAVKILKQLEKPNSDEEFLSGDNWTPNFDSRQNTPSTIRSSLMLNTLVGDFDIPMMFNYEEMKTENGSQIKIWRQDPAHEPKYIYRMSPSPRECYPNVNAPEFYHRLAEQLALNQLEENTYPQTLSTTILDIPVELSVERVEHRHTSPQYQEEHQPSESYPMRAAHLELSPLDSKTLSQSLPNQNSEEKNE